MSFKSSVMKHPIIMNMNKHWNEFLIKSPRAEWDNQENKSLGAPIDNMITVREPGRKVYQNSPYYLCNYLSNWSVNLNYFKIECV